LIKYGWEGIFKIKVNGKEEIIFNRVMDTALDEFIKVLQGLSTDMQIKYLALGTSDIAITNTQTTLGAEIFRTQFTTTDKTGIGELTNLAIVQDSEAVASIREIGVFGGSSATSTADTGVLISRILWSRDKTASEEIQFTRIDKITRG
jgi:hypothetical protein